MEPTVSVAMFETLRMSYSSVKNQVHSRTGSGRRWVVAGKRNNLGFLTPAKLTGNLRCHKKQL